MRMRERLRPGIVTLRSHSGTAGLSAVPGGLPRSAIMPTTGFGALRVLFVAMVSAGNQLAHATHKKQIAILREK